MNRQNPILLAFSGGLDTSFCVPWLKDTYKRPVVTITVNTGGLDDEAMAALQTRAMELGAERHLTVDAKGRVFRPGTSIPDLWKCPPWSALPSLCRRRAGPAGPDPGPVRR